MTGTILALIESPSDKHQRHARRCSTNVSRIHTAIRQKSAANTPLFNKCQRHTHRYLTNVSGIHRYSTKFSGIHTAIRQMSAVYTPPVDKSQRQSRPLYSASRASSRKPASSSRVKPRAGPDRDPLYREDMAAVVSTLWPPRVLAIGVDPPPRPIVLRVDHGRLFLESF